MEHQNSHVIEQALAANAFVSHDLRVAVERLAARRGENLDDIQQPGWARTVTTEEDGFDTNERISFTASYDIDDDGERGFTYSLNKTAEVQRDMKECTVDELLGVYDVLHDADNEYISEEQRNGLLQLVTAYTNGALDSDIEVMLSREMRLICRAESVDAGISIEKTMLLSIDGTLVAATSVGDIDIAEEVALEYENAAGGPGSVFTLPSETELGVDLSTPTVEDIQELMEMLQMLGLADRSQIDTAAQVA